MARLRPSTGRARILQLIENVREDLVQLTDGRGFELRPVVAGLHVLRKVMSQPVMRKLIAEEHAPGPQCQSDADLLAYARNTGTTVYHPTSTCRMGSDPTAVVDERLRLRGFERLRVVDASIMPTVVSGNTNAAAVMIGEKGSDMILQDAAAQTPIALSA